jgi:hypothetical protein
MKLEEVYWADVKQVRGVTDEFCSMDGELRPDGFPIYRVTIEEKFPSGRPYAKTTFSVTFDQIVARHIQNHPIFKLDCRPFILWSVRETIWQLKLVKAKFGEPTVIPTTLQTEQGGKIDVAVKAEVFIETQGTTLIHIVNYANTHLLDQMGEIFKQSPESRPSKQYVESKKSEFYDRLAADEAQTRRFQTRNLKNRKVIGGKYTVFIDESGDIGFRDSTTEYVCSAFMVEHRKLKEFSDSLNSGIASVWKNTRPNELHFAAIPESKLAPALKVVEDCFSRFGVETLGYIIRKQDFFLNLLRGEAETRRREEHPIVTNIADKLADPDGHVGRKFLAVIVEEIVAHIGVDAVDHGFELRFVHDRKHRSWMNKALETGFERGSKSLGVYSSLTYGQDLVPEMQFTIADSGQAPGLWVSDWLCWEIGRWLRGAAWSPQFEKAVSRIKFLCFDRLGKKHLIERPGGKKVQDFPDWPRVIEDIA